MYGKYWYYATTSPWWFLNLAFTAAYSPLLKPSVSVSVYCVLYSCSMAGNWIVSAEINWSVGSIFLWTLEFLNFDINMHSIVTQKNIWRHCHKQANLIGCIFAIIMIIGCLLKCLLINIIMKMFYRSLPISMWWQLALEACLAKTQNIFWWFSKRYFGSPIKKKAFSKYSESVFISVLVSK